MNVVYHPLARDEVIETAQYYEAQRPGLGVEFLDEIDASIQRIVGHPRGFAFVKEDVRQKILRRFPYSILYRIIQDDVRILVVRHHSRHPDHGQERY